jgi:hypothetical protein
VKGTWFMAHAIATLKKLSKDELIKEHDSLADRAQVGINYYLDEIRYREQLELADKMEALTKQMWWFTSKPRKLAVIPAKRSSCGARAGTPLWWQRLRQKKRGSKSPAIGRAFGMTVPK